MSRQSDRRADRQEGRKAGGQLLRLVSDKSQLAGNLSIYLRPLSNNINWLLYHKSIKWAAHTHTHTCSFYLPRSREFFCCCCCLPASCLRSEWLYRLLNVAWSFEAHTFNPLSHTYLHTRTGECVRVCVYVCAPLLPAAWRSKSLLLHSAVQFNRCERQCACASALALALVLSLSVPTCYPCRFVVRSFPSVPVWLLRF